MPEYYSKWEIEQKNIMLNKTMSIAQKLQDARKQIAKPYVLVLEKQFPNEDVDNLIHIADEDLYKSNEYYRKLTEKLSGVYTFQGNIFNNVINSWEVLKKLVEHAIGPVLNLESLDEINSHGKLMQISPKSLEFELIKEINF